MVVVVRWRQRRRLILRLRRFLEHRFGVVGRSLVVIILCPRSAWSCPCPKWMSVLVVGLAHEAVDFGFGSTSVVVAARVAAVVAFVAAVAAMAADVAFVAVDAAAAAVDVAVAAAFAAACAGLVCVDDLSAVVDVEFVARCRLQRGEHVVVVSVCQVASVHRSSCRLGCVAAGELGTETAQRAVRPACFLHAWHGWD